MAASMPLQAPKSPLAAGIGLRPADRTEIRMLFGWLSDPENSQWLDFGAGPAFSLLQLKLLLERDDNYLRLFTSGGAPIGLVAFSNVHRRFRTATLWYVLGDRAYGGRGCTTRAVSMLLAAGFGELGLESVQAWTVECNAASIKILERNGFRFIGRQRKCHIIGGQSLDRLLFDLLKAEYQATAAA